MGTDLPVISLIVSQTKAGVWEKYAFLEFGNTFYVNRIFDESLHFRGHVVEDD